MLEKESNDDVRLFWKRGKKSGSVEKSKIRLDGIVVSVRHSQSQLANFFVQSFGVVEETAGYASCFTTIYVQKRL